MKKFGRYLQHLRNTARLDQKTVAAKVTKLGRPASQSLIAQYETGRIADPDPRLLRLLADCYGRDYAELVLRLAIEKYGLDEDAIHSGALRERLNLWEAALVPSPTTGNVSTPSLIEAQLRAKAHAVAELEIIDMEGMAEWEANFRDLHTLWIVAPNFLDDRDPRIRQAVADQVEKDATILYFIRKDDQERFVRLQSLIAAAHPRPNLRAVQRLVLGVPLEEKDLAWIFNDLVIANPLPLEGAVGFESIRRDGTPKFAFRMDRRALEDTVATLADKAQAALGAEKIVAFPKKAG